MRIVAKPSPAMAVAVSALVVAMGGTTWAVSSLPPNSVGTSQLKNRAVVTAKLADKAVTSRTLARAAVTSGRLAAGAVRRVNIADGSITARKVRGTSPPPASRDSRMFA